MEGNRIGEETQQEKQQKTSLRSPKVKRSKQNWTHSKQLKKYIPRMRTSSCGEGICDLYFGYNYKQKLQGPECERGNLKTSGSLPIIEWRLKTVLQIAVSG